MTRAVARAVELNFFPNWKGQLSSKKAIFAQNKVSNFLFALMDLISNSSYSA
jgi:hypothetical protein